MEREKYLAMVLGFAHNKELFEKLGEQNKSLAEEITRFHIRTSIAEGVEILEKQGVVKITISTLRQTMLVHLFNNNSNSSELELRLQTFLSGMIGDGWLNQNLNLTLKGKKILALKKEAFYLNNNTKDFVN